MLEDGVAEPVPDDVRRRAAGRPGTWRPNLAGFFVANVERLAGCVLDRIVLPWGEAEFVRVLEPGVSAAAFREDRAELRVRDDVDPRCRSRLAGREGDDILVPVAGESAVA